MISRLLQIIISFAEYSLFYRAFLQKRLMFWGSLLIVATPYKVADTRRMIIFLCYFPQKSLIIIGSFAERDLQLKAPYAFFPFCTPSTPHQITIELTFEAFYHSLFQYEILHNVFINLTHNHHDSDNEFTTHKSLSSWHLRHLTTASSNIRSSTLFSWHWLHTIIMMRIMNLLHINSLSSWHLRHFTTASSNMIFSTWAAKSQ